MGELFLLVKVNVLYLNVFRCNGIDEIPLLKCNILLSGEILDMYIVYVLKR